MGEKENGKRDEKGENLESFLFGRCRSWKPKFFPTCQTNQFLSFPFESEEIFFPFSPLHKQGKISPIFDIFTLLVHSSSCSKEETDATDITFIAVFGI
jgi:hypothetical protein